MIRSKGLQEATKRDLEFEAHVVGVSMGYRIWAVVGAIVLGLLLLMGAGLMAAGGFGSGTAVAILLLLIFLGICGFWYAVGHFLSRFSNGARILAGVLAVLSAVSQSASLLDADGIFDVLFTGLMFVWTGAVIWLLFNRRAVKICSAEYRELVQKTRYIKPAAYKSPFFWIPFFITGVFFIYIWVVLIAVNV